MIKIALAQLNPVVGAFDANIKKIQEVYERACSEQARLLLTSELVVCGYPLNDWLDRPETLERTERAVQELTEMTRGQKCALAIGHIAPFPSDRGRLAQNVVSILENGQVVFRQAKTLLPTYDVFDEARYFEPSREVHLWNCDGHSIAVAICEDLWGEGSQLQGKHLYHQDPVVEYQRLGAKALLSLSSSPYEMGKFHRREKIHQEIAKRLRIPLIYVNQVSATDEILFDGGSFALDSEGEIVGRLPFFKTATGLVTLFKTSANSIQNETLLTASMSSPQDSMNEMKILADGLVFGIREYFARTGFKKAILGLSGGIDSAVIASLAVQALGPQNVLGVAMPSQYSSGHSLEDAEILAKNLKIPLEVRPIKFLNATATRELSEGRGQLNSIALENLQSRLRGMILMTLSNHDSSLVLTTGNKSELAMGYCTLYGDMNGALSAIGDLYKTQVYELARYLNQSRGGLIPLRSITKPPSAELKPNQADQDTLPPYETLDFFLRKYLEENQSITLLEKEFEGLLPQSGKNSVKDLCHRINLNEYKRRQSAPILKVSTRAFGLGRRIPLAKKW